MKYLWLFEPDAVLVTPLVTGALWALGGSGILALRRFGVGVFLAIASLSLGCPWYLSAISCVVFITTSSLPYGDKIYGAIKPLYYPYLFVLGSLYSLSLLPLCFHFGHWLTLVIGSLSCGLFFSLATFASKSEAFNEAITWKKVEIGVGLIIGFIAYKLYL